MTGCSRGATDPPGRTAQPSADSGRAAAKSQPSVFGTAPAAAAGMPTLIVMNPRDAREPSPAAEKPIMDQVAMTFVPSLLMVRTGQPTEFRNSDDELHNVRVREDATGTGTFNVAIPTGAAYEHTFENEGFYDVGCDIHPGMSATIYASASPFTTTAGPDGAFSFTDVAPGVYTVTAFAGAARHEQTITVADGPTRVVFAAR
jgi:plastocyanin